MLPTFELGPWTIHTYNLVYALAALVAGTVFIYRMRRWGTPVHQAGRSLLWIILGGIAGANLGAMLALLYRLLAGSAFPLPLKGSSILGALLGGIVVAALRCRQYRISLWQAADVGIPALPLGQAIGRLGCLAEGCCFGRPTDSWLGLYLPDHSGLWAMRYPTQLLSAAADLLIFALLLALARHIAPRPRPTTEVQPSADPPREQGRRDGLVTLAYFGLFLLKRFNVEFLRGDALPALVGPLNSTHFICAAGLLLAAGLALGRLRRVAVAPAAAPDVPGEQQGAAP